MNTRRQLVLSVAAVAAALPPRHAWPGLMGPLGCWKVAAIYTVPFEQQWVSRIIRHSRPPKRAATSS